jgi:hypothetical protein
MFESVHNGRNEISGLFSLSGRRKCHFAGFSCAMIPAGGYVGSM